MKNFWLQRETIVAYAVGLLALTEIIDLTIVQVAFPQIMGTFHVGYDTIATISTSYIIAAAIFSPIAGLAIKRLGIRKLTLISAGVFLLFSVLCGLAQLFVGIVTLRFLQGVGGSFFPALAHAYIAKTFKGRQQELMITVLGGIIVMGPILGPILGGVLTGYLNWRFIFFVNVPICVIAFLIIYILMPNDKGSKVEIDGKGFIMMALGVACLEYVIDYGHSKNWFQSNEITIIFSISVLFLLFFVWRSSTQKSVININLFKNKNFILNIITMFVCTLQITGSIAYIPTLLQIVYGYPVEITGFMSAPRGVSAVISAPLIQWLTGKIGQREMMSISTLLFSAACYVFSHYGSTLNENEFYLTMILQGFAMIGFFIPVLQICFVGIKEAEQGDAAGIFSFFRNFANSVGISLTGTVAMQQMSVVQQSMEKFVSPFAAGYLTWSNNLANLPEEFKLILAKVEIEKQSLLIGYLDAFYLYANFLLMICWMPFMLNIGPEHKTTVRNAVKKIEFAVKKLFIKLMTNRVYIKF